METTPHNQEKRSRGRLAVLWGAAALVWCAWGYCGGEGGRGLLWTTAVLAVVAAVLPRPFPGNARWLIWTWVAVTLACLAANVERLAAPEEVWDQRYIYDRLATVAYAFAVSALFFRLSSVGVTKIMIGALPMMMVTLGQQGVMRVTAPLAVHVYMWVFVVLAVVLDHARQTAMEKGAGGLPFSWRERALRLGWLTVMLGAAVTLRAPVERVAVVAQRKLLGMSGHLGRDRMPGTDLPLYRALPTGFDGRLRIVLLLQFKSEPGYLRGSVFTTYADGRWLSPSPGSPLKPKTRQAGQSENVYELVALRAGNDVDEMRVEVLSPQLLTALCLPGNAVALRSEGVAPHADANGMVTTAGGFPLQYGADVVACRRDACAYPAPDGLADPAYLAVPPALAGAVSNWTEGCTGLLEAPTAGAAAQCIANYFARQFRYRADVKLRAKPDPLSDFMTRREGFCVHFASAAALMLRSRGIPARVVGGYVCGEWDAWLKRWVVREREAHAWTEAWDRDAGQWLVVEATPPDGRPEAYAEPGYLRHVLDLVMALWKRMIAALKTVNFLTVIAEWGALLFWAVGRLVWGFWGLLLLVAGGIAAVWWRMRARRRLRAREDRLRAALTEAMCRIARHAVPDRLRRREAECWDFWLARIRPTLQPDAFAELHAQVEQYQQLRYRVRLDRAAAEAWLARDGRKHPPQ